jgi:hypothetical protein
MTTKFQQKQYSRWKVCKVRTSYVIIILSCQQSSRNSKNVKMSSTSKLDTNRKRLIIISSFQIVMINTVDPEG